MHREINLELPTLTRTFRGSNWLTVVATFALCGALTVPAFAAHHAHSKSRDQHFMTEAIQGDLAEVDMGKLAQEKGQTNKVKQFGQMLEHDHSANLRHARQVASRNGLKTPSEPNAMQRSLYGKLSRLPNNRFDAAFARDMVRDHKKDISKYRKEAKSGSPLAEFAKQTIPVLQKHLRTAEALTSNRNVK